MHDVQEATFRTLKDDVKLPVTGFRSNLKSNEGGEEGGGGGLAGDCCWQLPKYEWKQRAN